jgi:transketolase
MESGLGLAERWLRSRFGPDLVDHYTFVICSDGDLEEGISHEAASLAGHLGLGRLVYIYDDNHISIDGPTELALSDDPVGRFEAYGWHAKNVGEIANDTVGLEGAIREAMAVEDKPSLIVLRSHIGWPSPHKTDSAAAHGDPLGVDEVRETKQILGLPPQESFYVPDEVLSYYRSTIERGAETRRNWQGRFDAWTGDRAVWDACMAGRGLEGWEKKLPIFKPGDQMATRKAINTCLNAVADDIPGLIAGSGDLTGNTGLKLDDGVNQEADSPGGSQVHYGIREHAMASIMNGIAMPQGTAPDGRDLLRVQRLHASGREAGVALAVPRRLLVDPRLGWSRAGRPDPPADRASRVASRDAEPHAHQAGGRERNRSGARDRDQCGRSGRARAHPAVATCPREHGRARSRGCSAWRVCLVEGGLGRAGRGPGGNRQ